MSACLCRHSYHDVMRYLISQLRREQITEINVHLFENTNDKFSVCSAAATGAVVLRTLKNNMALHVFFSLNQLALLISSWKRIKIPASGLVLTVAQKISEYQWLWLNIAGKITF